MLLYSSIFVLLLSIISIGYYRPRTESARPTASVAATASSSTGATNLDEKTATDVAANFAMQTQMPVAANVANLSTSLEAKQEIAQADDTVIAKPQIVQPTGNDRAVVTYKTKPGDSVQSIAEAHKISAQTLKWANNLQSDAVEVGRDLSIPPVDGIVYTAQEGDTVQSIAARYQASPERIISFNDLEVAGVKKDMQIIVPGGIKPAEPAPAPAFGSNRSSGNGVNSGTTGQFGSTANLASARASAGNAYAPGNCTWYVYERRAQLGRPVGSFWGNASTWAINGAAAGLTVNKTPAPGAILQNGGGYAGYGHVAVVETINPDGTFTVSEMNYVGFNVVSSRTIPMSNAGNYNFIH